MNPEKVMKRLKVAEKKLASAVEKAFVVVDFDGFYFGDCGLNLSQEQFDDWLKHQDPLLEIIVMRYTSDGASLPSEATLNESSIAHGYFSPEPEHKPLDGGAVC